MRQNSFQRFSATVLLLAVCVISWAYDFKANGIYYSINADGVSVTVTYKTTSYNSYSGSINIPSQVIYNSTTYNVTGISIYAFRNCSELTSVTIPNSVISIGSFAFIDCNSLTKAEFASIESLCNISFGSSGANPLYYAKHLYINGQELTDLVIPNSVTSIGDYTFSGCCGLTSVNIPNSITSIGEYAFLDCSGLTTIAIPNSVTNIGNHAFKNCSGLTSVTIPNSVTSIGMGTFYNTRLKSVTIGAGVLSIASVAFSFDTNQGSNPIKVIWLTNTPPSGYESVGGTVNYVANNLYTSLSNVTVYPFLSSIFDVEGIKYVPVSPSERTCDAIDCTYNADAKQIDIAETVSYKGVAMKVQTVKQYTCYDNTTIEKLNLSFNGSVENNAFQGCTGLQNATINNKGNIGTQAFYGCTGLQNAIIRNNGSIGESAFENSTSGSNPATFEISNTGDISSRAFYGCTGLQNVTISNNGNIGGSAFENSTSGSNPATFEILNTGDISSRAFYGCTGLQSVRIKNKGDISSRAFYGCTGLETVTLGIEIPSIGNYAFYNCSKLQGIDIPDAVRTIGTYIFYGCTSMETATVGNGVTSIPEYAFSGCSNLTSVQIGQKAEAINTYAFSGCSSLADIKIGQSTKTFGKYSFQNCSSLSRIEIPKSVTNINDYTFSGCKALATVIMEEREDNTVLSLGSNASSPIFASCPLDSVYIGRNISYNTSSNYGYSPFYRNTSLRSVTITDKETEISPNEFYGCTNLANVSIGNGVTTIGSWAFSGCSSLDYFAFGSSVTQIGQEAFSDCTSITKIIAKATTPPTCGSQALDDINKWNCVLKVPEGSMEAYQKAGQWKEFFFIEECPEYILGDANGNGEVEIGDVTSVLTLMATPEATGYNNKAADANGNGEIEIGDVTTILTIMAGE